LHKWVGGGGVGLLSMGRTVVVWKSEDEEDGGEAVGPVWVDTFGDDERSPASSEKWDRWVHRSEAARYAEQHGYEFMADE
jgi:hypothetical protein